MLTENLFSNIAHWFVCCYRRILHKMNKIHERSLRLLLQNYKDDFQDLLRSSGDISIHQRCINSLLTEVYKYIHGLSPEIMNEVFSTRANIYNTRQSNVFEIHIPTSNRYGLNSIPYKGTKPNQLWNLLSENLKSSLPCYHEIFTMLQLSN